jgi:hypothetical protein
MALHAHIPPGGWTICPPVAAVQRLTPWTSSLSSLTWRTNKSNGMNFCCVFRRWGRSKPATVAKSYWEPVTGVTPENWYREIDELVHQDEAHVSFNTTKCPQSRPRPMSKSSVTLRPTSLPETACQLLIMALQREPGTPSSIACVLTACLLLTDVTYAK